VSVAQLERGDFPMVCATSGQPADVKLGVNFRARHGHPAVWGMLPFATRAQRRLQLLVRVRYAVLIGGFLLLVALTLLGQWQAAKLAGIPIVLVALILNVAGAALSIDGRADTTGQFVHLRGVHKNFVTAVLKSG